MNDTIVDFKKHINNLENENADLKMKLLVANETLMKYKDRLFGKKSEKFVDDGPSLFNEAETEIEDEETPKENTDSTETETITYERKKKSGRKPISDDISRIDTIIDLTPEEKVEFEAAGKLAKIGEDVSEKLIIIPQVVKAERIILIKYAFTPLDGKTTIITAKAKPQIIPNGIASASSLAYVFTSKFVDGLPYYRQETIFSRLGIDLSRQTMSNWQSYAYSCYLVRLIDLMKKDLKSSFCIGADETTVNVIQKDGTFIDGKGYMWVYRGYQDDRTIQLFDYKPDRRGIHPDTYLDGYSGYLQTDGYSGYNATVESGKLHHMACWAHVRRKFMDVNKNKETASDSAKKIIKLIGKLYDIERTIKEKKLHIGAVYSLRQKESKVVLNEIYQWLITNEPKYPPSLNMGKAIQYALNQWSGLEIYLEDGRLHIDNNLVEGAIRPFAIGRKNWLFSYSAKGADSSAAIYSLIETAKSNGREPYSYLNELFEKLPDAKSDEDYRKLLPY